MLKTPVLLCAIASVLWAPATLAQWLQFGNSAIAEMNDSDVELLQKSGRDALENARDGETREWSNPQTGVHGSITPLKTYQAYDTTCRLVRFENFAAENSGRSTISLCKSADGSWKAAPAQTITEMPDKADSHAEHCQELDREVEALEGKPLRHSAAADRYRAECQELPPAEDTGGGLQ